MYVSPIVNSYCCGLSKHQRPYVTSPWLAQIRSAGCLRLEAGQSETAGLPAGCAMCSCSHTVSISFLLPFVFCVSLDSSVGLEKCKQLGVCSVPGFPRMLAKRTDKVATFVVVSLTMYITQPAFEMDARLQYCSMPKVPWRKVSQVAHKLQKSVKVFSLESFPLYGIIMEQPDE